MSVLVLHTLPPDHAPPGRAVEEFDLRDAADAIACALPDAAIAGVRGEPEEIIATVAAHRPDVVFNLCEAPLGDPALEAHAASLLEWMRVPFTGSGSETLALCRRKDRVSGVLAAAGIRVPRPGGFPCIVKPADEDGSVGIDADSVCESETELTLALARLDGPVVVEEFLPGREFAVSLWGSTRPEHTSLGEFRFEDGMRVNTYASKWEEESAEYVHSPLIYDVALDAELRDMLTATARETWRVVAARGYLRIDLRLDVNGMPRVIDVNPNPSLSPDTGIHRAAREAGWTWEAFVRAQVEWAHAL